MKINYWRILAILLVAAVAFVVPFDVWAASGDPFGSLKDKVCQAWKGSKQIVYIIGGIAALTLGVLAFFGRFKWTTFFALVGGIFLIAIFDTVLSWTTDAGEQVSSVQC